MSDLIEKLLLACDCGLCNICKARKRIAELESTGGWVCRDATHHEEGDCCLVKIDALEALEQALKGDNDE